MSRDSNFLNDRLRQLKESVLSNKQEEPENNVPEYLKENEGKVNLDYTKYSVGMDSEANLDTPMGYQAAVTQPIFKEIPKPTEPVSYEEFDQKLADNFKNLDLATKVEPQLANFKRPTSGYKNQENSYVYESTSPYIREEVQTPTLIRKTNSNRKIVHSVNAKVEPIASQPEYKNNFIVKPAELISRERTTMTKSIIPEQRVTIEKTTQDTSNSFPIRSNMVYSLAPNGNESIIGIEKHENKLYNELGLKIEEQDNKNNLILIKVNELRQTLERENNKTSQMESMLSSESDHLSRNREELVRKINQLRVQQDKLEKDIKSKKEKQENLNFEFQQIEKDNNNLRTELKRFGAITSEKISDLENSLKDVNRMKIYENESFEMDREKINNSSDFIREQINIKITEHQNKHMQLMSKTLQEKEKSERALRVLKDQLKGYNTLADQKINNEMGIVFREEEDKNQRELREVEEKIRLEDDEVNKLHKKIQEAHNKLKMLEKENKTKIIGLTNQNLKLREESDAADMRISKIIVQIKNEEKELEKRNIALDAKLSELEELKEKMVLTETRYNDEVESIQAGHEDGVKELEHMLKQFNEEENRLKEAIQSEQERLNEYQQQHNATIDQLRNNVNSSVQNQFTRLTTKKVYD